MDFARGQLYQHRLRPQWGAGLFVGIIDGKPQLSFEDGILRGFVPSARASFVEAAPSGRERIVDRDFKPDKPAARQGPRVWTAERDAELRTLDALKLPESEIAKRMGMTKDAVANRRSVLGLGRRAAWSAADEARLRELVASKIPNVTIASELGRTLAAIRARRRHLDLGVEQLPRWTASEDQLACSDLSPDEIAASTGRSKRSVFNRRVKIGATKRPCKRWTAEDDARVLAGGSTDAMALALGRTVGAVEHRARLLAGRSR
jgi:hypothetical protein